MMTLGFKTLMVTSIAFILMLTQPCFALTIEPGVDLWTTPAGGQSSKNFADNPIPPDFFGPGSEPFFGKVCLQGQPLQTTPPGMFGPTDLIIERLDTLELPAIGAQDQIPIEIVALSLTSCEPITVTYNGGTSSEQWIVNVTLSDLPSTLGGNLTVTQDCFDGGSFQLDLQFLPKFTFINADNPSNTVVLETGDPIILNNIAPFPIGSWTSSPSSAFQILQSDGGTTVDHDVNPLTPELLMPPGSFNFYPGVLPLPCDPVFPSSCQAIEIFQLLENNGFSYSQTISPPVIPFLPIGATCLPDGRCVMTTASCALNADGTYLGDETTCINAACLLPLPGVQIDQVSYIINGLVEPNSKTGRLEVDVPVLLSDPSIDSGYINIITDLGWVVQNLKIDGTGKISTYFQITETAGEDVNELLADVHFTESPLEFYHSNQRALYGPIPDYIHSANGFVDNFLAAAPEPIQPNFISFFPSGLIERHTQPNASNVQAANNQCFPMGIANSLQYLEDRYGLPVPHVHAPGLKGDSTLVGQLDSLANRGVTNRQNGSAIGFPSMMNGKFQYMKDNNLKGKIVTKHQGHAEGGHAGDYTASGITSKDESVNGKVTYEWICNELKKGEDVELGYRSDDGGGHIVRIFECGKTLGIPWLGYVHDSKQSDQDPGDSLGLEKTRAYILDIDGDSVLNFGSPSREIRLVVSESADTDRDGVTNGIDNAPNLYNPGQEDSDGNGVGDVAEPQGGTLEVVTIAPFDLDAVTSQSFGPYPNPLPENPDHKDIWFVGTAFNPNPLTSGKITISFLYVNSLGDEIFFNFPDTTEIPPLDTFEIFGAQQIDFCPDSVSVIIESVEGDFTNVMGTLNHICYPSEVLDCCIGLRGNIDGDLSDMLDIADLVYFVDYAFGSPQGPAPPCLKEADVNGDGSIDIADIVYLVAFMFGGGPAPVPCL